MACSALADIPAVVVVGCGPGPRQSRHMSPRVISGSRGVRACCRRPAAMFVRHMYPLGILFGLGLETASEVTLLTLAASTAQASGMSLMATLSLPLLFAAGGRGVGTPRRLLVSVGHFLAPGPPAGPVF